MKITLAVAALIETQAIQHHHHHRQNGYPGYSFVQKQSIPACNSFTFPKCVTEAETAAPMKLQADQDKHDKDYFVPNFGVDHDVITTQSNLKNAEQSVGHQWKVNMAQGDGDTKTDCSELKGPYGEMRDRISQNYRDGVQKVRMQFRSTVMAFNSFFDQRVQELGKNVTKEMDEFEREHLQRRLPPFDNPFPDRYGMHDNYCVNAEGKDLLQTKMMNTDLRSCMQMCEANEKCSATEWYEAGWEGSKCYHMNLGWKEDRAVRGSPGIQWRDARCFTRTEVHVIVGNPFPDQYKLHDNYCVSAEGKDLHQRKKMQHTDQKSCMQQCVADKNCSAIEWYQLKMQGTSCFHMITGWKENRAVKGSTGPQWRDAKCLTRHNVVNNEGNPFPDRYDQYNNYCVNAEGKDILQTKMQHTDQRSCMQQCEANPQCSAIEWYAAQWHGSSCYHMNLGFDKDRAVRGSSGVQWRDAKCLVRKEAHVTVGNPFPDRFDMHDNYCVSSDGKDQQQTKMQHTDQRSCMQLCDANPKCSGVEWYQLKWQGTSCFHMLGRTPSVRGSTGVQWRDAMCFTRPAKGKQ